MTTRLWITAIVLVSSTILLHASSHGEPRVPAENLQGLPYTIGSPAWIGKEHPLDQRVTQSVAVTDYTNRVYSRDVNENVQLYVGYYASQRTGDTVHSPKNCLPGSGWDPIQAGYATIPLRSGRTVIVNEYVIQRDEDKELVFYWYQGRGRVIASEYDAKFWMVVDAISRNRTDGSLVRIITPTDGEEAKARNRLISFARDLFPHLDRLLPN